MNKPAKKKYYVIVKGRKTGIFAEPWKVVEKYVSGFAGADFKGFESLQKAQEYWNQHKPNASQKAEKVSPLTIDQQIAMDLKNDIIPVFIDGSFKENAYGYGILFILGGSGENLKTKAYKNKFDNSKNNYTEIIANSRNVFAEVMGALVCFQIASAKNYAKIRIYYDYAGLEKWLTDSWKAEAPVAQHYKKIYEKNYKDKFKLYFYKVPSKQHKFNVQVDKLAKEAIGIE